jgi:peroxiredoxin
MPERRKLHPTAVMTQLVYMRSFRLVAAVVLITAAVFIVVSAGLPDRAEANRLEVFNSVSESNGLNIAAEIGAAAPPFTTHSISGTPLDLRALKGSAVIVNFWATWCGPCVTEMPALQAAYEKFQSKGLTVIGINSGEPVDTVIAWQARQHLTFPLAIDDGTIQDWYRVRGLPSSYFIGRDGTIKQIVFGPLPENLDPLINDILK